MGVVDELVEPGVDVAMGEAGAIGEDVEGDIEAPRDLPDAPRGIAGQGARWMTAARAVFQGSASSRRAMTAPFAATAWRTDGWASTSAGTPESGRPVQGTNSMPASASASSARRLSSLTCFVEVRNVPSISEKKIMLLSSGSRGVVR